MSKAHTLYDKAFINKLVQTAESDQIMPWEPVSWDITDPSEDLPESVDYIDSSIRSEILNYFEVMLSQLAFKRKVMIGEITQDEETESVLSEPSPSDRETDMETNKARADSAWTNQRAENSDEVVINTYDTQELDWAMEQHKRKNSLVYDSTRHYSMRFLAGWSDTDSFRMWLIGHDPDIAFRHS